MNVTMILFGFFPWDTRVRKEALTLSKAGHKVQMVCCSNSDTSTSFHSIRIQRVSDWKGKMTLKQLLTFWLKSFYYLISNRNFDVLHCHDLTGLPPAVLYKFLFPRTKIIYDSHEIFPDMTWEKLGKLVGFPAILLEKFSLRFVNKIIGVSLPQKELMQKRYNIRQFFFLPNFQSEKEFFATEKPSNEKLIIIYSGGIHKDRGYEQLVEAIEILRHRQIDFIVQLVGDGPLRNKIERMVKRKKLEQSIEFVGAVPPTMVRDYLNKADIGIALYQPIINNYYSLSNKLFEYLVCGVPMIYPYYKGSSMYLEMIEAVGVNPTSPKSIARKVEFLITHPEKRERMRQLALDHASQFTWEQLEDTFLEFYKAI